MSDAQTITVERLVSFLQQYPPNTRIFFTKPGKLEFVDQMNYRNNSALLDDPSTTALVTTFHTALGGEAGGTTDPDMLQIFVPLS